MQKIIHVTGSTCSGSSMIASIISSSIDVAGIGEDHIGINHYMKDKLNEANRLAWDSTASFDTYEYHLSRIKSMIENICNLDIVKDKTHIVFRRSIFQQGGYGLNISDFLSTFPNSKIVICYRDPRACAWSAFKKQLGENLRHCCTIQFEQLTSMISQLSPLPENSYKIFSYEKICNSIKTEIKKIADFCEINYDSINLNKNKLKINKANMNSWYEEADSKDRDRIYNFFNQRFSIFNFLTEKAQRE